MNEVRKEKSENLVQGKMKKLELIAFIFILSSTLVEISISVSLYTIISDAEHVLNDNRIPKKLQPVELMVDATNSLGATILDLHSRNNKNNIAFSPCGLMSVLVALFEGSAGKSAIELKEALNFPHERDIVRIGVRDIHRRLRVSSALMIFTPSEQSFIANRYKQEEVDRKLCLRLNTTVKFNLKFNFDTKKVYA